MCVCWCWCYFLTYTILKRKREKTSIHKMVLLDNDQFLTEMTKLYQRNRLKGSVWTTMKSSLCLNRPKRNAPILSKEEEKEKRCCLVRCSDGKRKISTRVFSQKAEKFAREFTLVQKASIDGLKETEKKKKKKTTEDEKKKKKKKHTDAKGDDEDDAEKKKKTKKKRKKKSGGGGTTA